MKYKLINVLLFIVTISIMNVALASTATNANNENDEWMNYLPGGGEFFTTWNTSESTSAPSPTSEPQTISISEARGENVVPLLRYQYGDSSVSLVNFWVYESKGKSYLVLNADFSCRGNTPANFLETYVISVYQDGIECIDGTSFPSELGDANASRNVKSGATIKVYVLKELNNTLSDIEVSIVPLNSSNNGVTKSFPLKTYDPITGLFFDMSIDELNRYLNNTLVLTSTRSITAKSLNGILVNNINVLGRQCNLLSFNDYKYSLFPGCPEGILCLFKISNDSSHNIYIELCRKINQIFGETYSSEAIDSITMNQNISATPLLWKSYSEAVYLNYISNENANSKLEMYKQIGLDVSPGDVIILIANQRIF